MAKVELKQPIVDEIAALFDGAASAVIVDYRGLTVEQDTILRKQLREAGISYKVYKNTLIKRAGICSFGCRSGRTYRSGCFQDGCNRSG